MSAAYGDAADRARRAVELVRSTAKAKDDQDASAGGSTETSEERVARLLGELKGLPAADVAAIAVALRIRK